MSDPVPHPRDAATIVIIRRDGPAPRVLMGQRGSKAAFMPSKFVFPGGAVDPADLALADLLRQSPPDAEALARHCEAPPAALALAAVRETWEETGLALGRLSDQAAALDSEDEHWRSFFAAGLAPALDTLDFIFRAVTPPARSRRFDARFFMVEAHEIMGDPDDLSRASGELSHLSWPTLAEARGMDLPFITEIVLAEVEARLRAPDAPRPIPFFHHADGRSFMDHL